MGTFLGNLTVLGGSLEEVSALLPGTTVGKWSERFVTVLHENYGMGTVERPARKVSKALPEATVLSAALVDSDLLELTVWQGGKRVTTRGHFPYDGTPKRGDPKKFCAALGLPDEDVPRLKAVWAKGDAEEQLELTAALLGTPLYCDTRAVPTEKARRDAEGVDQWLAQRPDPPKVKNQTRAEVVQELSGLEIPHVFYQGSGGYYQLRRTDNGRNLFYRWTPRGDLTLAPTPVPEPWLEEDSCWDLYYHEIAPDRMVVEGLKTVGDDSRGWFRKPEGIIADSAGLLSCPMPLELDGKERGVNHMWGLPDGGILIDYGSERCSVEPEGNVERDLARYAPDGAILWRKSLDPWSDSLRLLWDGLLWIVDSSRPQEEEYYALDLDGNEALRLTLPELPENKDFAFRYHLLRKQPMEGELWVVRMTLDRRVGKANHTLLRLDTKGQMLGEHPLPCDMADQISDAVILKDRVCIDRFDEGIWVLDGQDFSVLAGIEDHRSYMSLETDGAGRIWVAVSDSTWEAYDQDLNLLSRHRLKGGTMDVEVDAEGHLRVLTYDEKNHTLRVYAMKEI